MFRWLLDEANETKMNEISEIPQFSSNLTREKTQFLLTMATLTTEIHGWTNVQRMETKKLPQNVLIIM
jgi:hypothetical protein